VHRLQRGAESAGGTGTSALCDLSGADCIVWFARSSKGLQQLVTERSRWREESVGWVVWVAGCMDVEAAVSSPATSAELIVHTDFGGDIGCCCYGVRGRYVVGRRTAMRASALPTKDPLPRRQEEGGRERGRRARFVSTNNNAELIAQMDGDIGCCCYGVRRRYAVSRSTMRALALPTKDPLPRRPAARRQWWVVDVVGGEEEQRVLVLLESPPPPLVLQ
jgi:hypothetical protein